MDTGPLERARGGCRSRRARLVAAVSAALIVASSALAQSPPAAPAGPSAPPFWARPKPSAQSCPCDEKATAAPIADTRSALLTGLLSGSGLILLFLAARRFLRKPEAPEARARVTTPAPAPMPADPSLPAGFDPRARLVTARAAAKTEPAATTATQAPPADFAFEDPGTAPVELAQDEPAAESDRATEFYSEVAFSLMDALHKEPTRQDLRFKLIEIYFARKQVNEFVTLAHEYLDRNRGFRDNAWREISSMGHRLAPEHVLFGGAPKDVPRPVRRVHQMRRFHERDVDQGRMYSTQQALTADFEMLRDDTTFRVALRQILADAARRPSPLVASPELSQVTEAARIFLKHEDRRRFHDDMMMTVFGQMLVAQRLGRTRVVTATRDGTLGHTVASAAARLGLECMVYITERDLNRYYARVLSTRRLGAILRPIPGSVDQEQPDPRRAALEAWLNDPATTQYISGLTGGPAPYPEMIREFLSVIGRETAEQMQENTGSLPNAVVMAANDGHLGLGLLEGLLEPTEVKLYCVDKKAADVPVAADIEGGLEGATSLHLLTRREHRWLRATDRVEYVEGDEHETLRIIEKFHATGTTLYTDSARTMAYARVLARRMEPRQSVVVLLTSQEGADFRSTAHDW